MNIKINNTRKFLIPLLLLAAVFLLIGSASATPVANASVDQSVELGATVTLNGTASSDSDGGPITYNWTISNQPSASVATLQNPATNNPTFTPDLAGFYTLKLVVTDQYGVNSTPDFMELLAFKTTKITNSSSPDSYNPVKDGRYMVYEVYQNGYPDIYLYNVFTGQGIFITNDNYLQFYPNIYDNNIVWLDYQNGLYDVYVYNIESGVKRKITTQSTTGINPYRPGIYEDKIVYYDNRNGNWDIWLYDLSSNTERQITTNTEDQYDPVIYGNRIAWWDLRDLGNLNVYMYDLTTETETRISNSKYYGFSGRTLSLNDRYIVWDDERNSDATTQRIDIYMYDSQTGIERAVTTAPGMQYDPHISGDNIVWTDTRYGQYYTYIYMYNILTGAEFAIFSYNANPYGVDAYSPTIDGDHIVFNGFEYNPGKIFMVNIANQAPPVLESIGDKVVNEGQTLQFNLNGSDSGFDALTYSGTGLPTGATLNKNTFTWTPTYLQAGTYIVTFTVLDGSYTDSETITITVNNFNGPPVLNAIGSKYVSENQNLQFTLTSMDPDGDPVTYSVTGLPVGATLTGNVFSWTPTYDQSGTYTITFSASDGIATDSKTTTIIVYNVNRAPILDSIGPKNVGEGQTLSFILSGSDPDGTAVTFSATNLPTGATFSGNTFSWTPNYLQAGTYSVTFRASDGSLTDTEAVTITVNNVNGPPVLDTIGFKTVNENGNLSFTMTSTDPDADTLTYSATGLPNGATITGNVFSWTPTYDQSGTYMVTFTVTDGTGTDSEEVTLTVNNVNRPPEVTITGQTTVNEGSNLQFTVTGTDPDEDSVSFSASGIPAGASFNNTTGVFSWLPGYDKAGTYPVTFTFSDGDANTVQTVNLVINNVITEEVGAVLPNGVQIGSGAWVTNDVAFDGTKYLVVWHKYLEGIEGQFVDTNGNPVGSNFTISSTGRDPTITFNGTDYLVVYVSQSTYKISGRTVSTTGIVSDEFEIGTTNTGTNLDSSYATSSGKHLIVWYETGSELNFDIHGIILSSSGIPEGSEFLIANKLQSEQFPSVTTDGTDFLVLWFMRLSDYDRDIYASRVTSSGVVLDPSGIIITNATSYQGGSMPQKAAFDGQNYLVAWQDYRNGNYEIYAARISRAGVLLDGPSDTGGIPLSSGWPSAEGVAVGFNGSNWMVVWSSTRTSGRRVSSDGSVIESAPFLVTSATTYTYYPNIATDGTSYLMVWSASSGSNYGVFVQILSIINQKPVFDSVTEKTVSENQNLEFSVNAVDPDGDTITYSVTGLPAGATFTGNSFSWTPTPNQAGTYQVTFTASDGKLLDSETITITVDNVNQAPVFDSVGNRAVNEGQILEFIIISTDPDGDNVFYSATGLPAGAVLNSDTGAFTWTPTYDQAGTYPITFTVSDGILSDTETIDIVVGGVNRAPILDAVGDKTVNENDNLSFSVSGSDPDVDSVTYSAIGLPSGATFTGNSFTWTPGYNQAGSHTVNFIITDAGGLTDTETITINVENVNRPPALNSIGNQAVNEGGNLQFPVNATDPDGDALVITTSALPSGASFENGQFSWTPDYAQAGTYPVTFTVTDGVLSDSETIEIVVNNVNLTPILGEIGTQAVNENDNLSFSVSGSDPDGDSITYSASGLPEGATFTGNSFAWTPGYNQAGTYTVTFTISDGSLTDTEEVIINVGNVNRAPEMEVIGLKVVNEGENLSFTITSSDPDGDIVTYSANGLPEGVTFTDNSFTWTPGFAQAGTYTLTFIVSDGSLTDTEEVTITVNNVNQAPVLNSIGDKTVNENDYLSFSVSGSDPDGDSVIYSAIGLPSGATFTGSSFSWTPTYDEAGSYVVTFTITDAGGLSDTETITINVDNVNRAPVLDSIGDKSVDENSNLSFMVSGSDPDGDSLTHSVTGLPEGAIFTGNSFTWTPGYAQAGTYSVTFTVSDGTLSDSETITITVGNVNRAPVLDSIGDKSVDENSNLSFMVSGSDPDGDVLNYFLDNLPTGASFNPATGAFTWTPSYEQSGTYTLTFTVSDGTLSDTETVIVTVNPVNRPPVLNSIVDQAVEENSSLSFTVSGSDPDGDSLTYSVTGLPSGATFTGNTFSWTPTYEQSGTYTITFTVSDGALTDIETIIITVNNVNRAPLLAIIGAQTVNENDNLVFTISGFDPDGDGLTYTATALPSGATFDPANRAFSWAPGFTQAGTYTVTFTVSDGSLTDTEEVTITVNNVNQAPILNTVGVKVVDEGASLSFSVIGTDPDDDGLTYSVTNLPAGASFDSVSGAFSWTPSYDAAGSYTVFFTASDGGLSDSETVTITVNNINRVPVLDSIGDKAVEENQLLEFSLSASDQDGDIVTYSVTGLPSGATFTGNSFSWTPSFAQAGTYIITFMVSDGTLTDTQEVTITVGNVNRAPVLDNIDDHLVSENENLSFNVMASDPDQDSLTYTMEGLPGGATFQNNLFSWNPSYDQSGTYTVTFMVSDGTLTDTEEVTLTVSNVNRLPVLDSIGDKFVDENSNLSITVSGSDPDEDILTYAASDMPSGAIFDPVTKIFSWTPDYTQAGTYTVTFAVSDGSLSDTETITITVNNVNLAPVLGAVGSQVINEGESRSFTVEGSDPDGDTLTYSATGLPAGVTFDGNTFSWTPNFDQAGTYTITFMVTDGTLTDTEEVTITVVNVNQAPVLNDIGSKEIDENNNLSFTVTGTDPDGDALTYSVTDIPAGASLDPVTGAFSWTPGYDQAGSYVVNFTISDSGGLSDTETITITVDNVNRAPVLDAIGDKTVDENNNLSFTVSGSDPDGDTLSYSATGLPVGSTFGPSTMVFNWTPDFTQAGTYTVTFTVNDETSSVTEAVIITVNNVNRPPVMDEISDMATDEDQTLAFTVTATDPDGQALTYSATGLPDGAIFTGNSFSWTPSYDQAGAYPVTFTATDGSQSDSETITITVNNVNQAPILNSIGDKAVNEGNTLSFTLTGNDPDGDSVTYSAADLPTGASLDPVTGAFRWTPGYDQSGTYTVTFTVSDGGLSDSGTITITVNNVNRAPILTDIGTKAVGEAQNLNFAVSGTDPDSDALTYTSSSLPTGATFNVGVFDWTPTYDQAGTYTVTFTVSDGALSDVETVTITVSPVNRAPIANAGADVSVNRRVTRTLNGYGSSDPDGDTLTYSWTLTKPLGSTSVFYNANSPYPYFTPDLPGEYIAHLTVTDPSGASSTDSVTVTAVNQAPTANAGSDRTVNRNMVTTLSGGGYDSEGDTVSYSWTLTKPVGSNSVLNNANTGSPSFNPDLPGEYMAMITVTDQYGASSTDTAIITALNRNPVANAGPDENGRVGYTTALSGTGSSDPDGDSLTYAWTLTGPSGSTSTLSDSTSSQPTFTPDLPGEYVALLIVTDQYGGVSASDSVKVTVTYNQAPVAEAGNSFTVNRNYGVSIYGTGSYDPNGDLLTYYWSLTVPAGSLTTLNNPGISSPYFIPDLPGQYVATLVVTDSYGASSTPDSAVFTAENTAPYTYFESSNVLLGDSVDLDGTMSYDQDGDELTYLWEIIKPTGSQSLQDPTNAIQTFTPDVAGEYTVTLTVTDEYSASMSYERILIVRNTGEIVNSRTGISYPTIQEAVDDSEDEDTILVADGRYPEAIIIEYRNVDLQATGNNVVLDSVEGQPLITVYGGQSRISGFVMTGAYNGAALLLGYESETEITGNTITESYDGISIDESYIGHIITQNRITNNENHGINGYGIYYTTINGNEITNNGFAAIYLESPSDVVITNNQLTGNGYGILASGLDYATISGNNISDNSQRGISVSSVFDSEITKNIINNNVDYGIELYSGYNVSITRNVITNTEGYGLQFDGDFSDVIMNFNQISGNGLDLYYYNTEGQPLQAENNWWGSNSEPTNIEDSDGLVSYSPWLVLNLSADPQEILTGESSTIIADFTENSDGENTSSEGTLPDGLEVNFTANLGTINSSAALTDGKATVNYTAQEAGVATVSAAMDTEEVTTSIDVASPNRPPGLDLGDETIAEGDTLHLVLDGSDPDDDSLTYSISGQPPESSFDGSTGTFTWTPRYDQAGSYTVTFTVSDGSLTYDQTITITVENTNRAPEMQTIGDKSVNEGQAMEFEVEATDPDGTPLTYSLDMLPPDASFDSATGIFTWTPNYQQSGPNLLTFTVTDGELSDSETIHLDVVNVNQAPVLNPVSDQTVPEGQILEFTVDATDPDGQALSYTAGFSVQDLIQLGAVFNSETRTFTWTPNFDQAGSYIIPFTVSDGELSNTQLVNIVVENTNRMPTLMAIGNKDAYENQNLQFSVDALDADGDSLTYSAAGLPTGATFDPVTRIFSWTPTTGQSGTYQVTFTVSDGELSVSETININVYNTPSGSGVTVTPVDPVTGQSPVTISFSNVLSGGTTTVSTSVTGPEPPAGFVTGEPPLYYEISTTASYQPPITMAIHYEEGMFTDESALRLFHYENGAWMDITTSQDLVNNIIYGSVSSMSPFSVFERIANNAPTAVLDGPYAAYEGSEITFDGSASTDPDGDSLTYEWDLDGDGIYETMGMMVSKTWYDDYTGTVFLRVTDSHGLSSVTSSTVTVTNTAPSATLSSSFLVKVPITMRVAGQPGNSVELQIIQDGVVIASQSVVFTAGSPNEQEVNLLANIDMSKPYTARLVFNTNSQTSGATPVWLIIDGKKTKVATFKSNPNNPSSWSQTLNIPLKGLFTLANKEITFNAQASDSGVDTITFEWSFGDGTPLVVNTYTSDGTTVINDSVAHTYLQPGTYQLILRVRDDEGAEVTYQMEVRVQ